MKLVESTAVLVIVGCMLRVLGAQEAQQGQEATTVDDLSWIRGVNYVPSYARNDVQTWMDYDEAAIDRELGYAERLGLNSVRVFLNFAVYERDPKVFLERFENFLGLCRKHKITMHPVLFDSCFGEFPDLARYREKDWMANPGQNRLGKEHWPALEKYVADVVGRHKDDKRIVIWDVMNEPTCTSFNKDEDRKLIWTFLDHFLDYVARQDPSHPRAVGVESSALIPRVIDKVEVLAFHNYGRNLRDDIRRVKEMGAKAGKPVLINEVVRRDSQPFLFAMPILAREKIGWYVWELMLGSTQFSRGDNPVQGFVYPDGTCREATDVLSIVYPGGTQLAPREVAAQVGIPRRGGRWGQEEAWCWYRKQPWLLGVNFLPSTACNTTELWQADTFDEKTIDRELGWARDAGFNTCRVFVQYLVWRHDGDAFKKRFERFLSMALKHGISTVPVLFDDCTFGDPPLTEPYLGKQKDPIPGMIAPSWTPSPGLKEVVDKSAWGDLEKYVKDVVGTFGKDKRVVFWDLYNEPGNSGLGNKSLPLVEATFAWARQVNPRQPLTVSVWNGGLRDLNRRQIELSDVVSFHAYTNYEGMRGAIAAYRPHKRPIICTEWMARLQGSRYQTDLPLFKRQAVGCYSWGLVNGRMQCRFPWWSKRGAPEPKVWFHDIFHEDGRPYDPAEIEAIRKAAADKTFARDPREAAEFAAAEEQLGPGEINDTDPAVRYSDGWTPWHGSGPLCNTLHYNNTAGGKAELTFEGAEVHLIHKVGPDCGIAQVLVDGRPATKPNGGALAADARGQASLDPYGRSVDWNRRTPVAAGLAKGKHTLTILVTGQKNEKSSNTYVQIVGFVAR